jgi:hypothetical protein
VTKARLGLLGRVMVREQVVRNYEALVQRERQDYNNYSSGHNNNNRPPPAPHQPEAETGQNGRRQYASS